MPNAPTLQQIEELIDAARGWLKIALALGIYAGLRSGEIRALQVGDVDLKQGLIKVRRTLSEDEQETPKGHKERIVPVVPQLAAILEEAVRDRNPQDRIILTSRGTTPRRKNLLLRLGALQKRLRRSSGRSGRHWPMGYASHILPPATTGVRLLR